MTSKQKTEMYNRIQKHGETLISFFNLPEQDTIALCKKLFRLEKIANSLACDYCNGVIGTEEMEQAHGRVIYNLEKIIGKENTEKCFFNQDPRGYSLKIKSEFSKNFPGHKDWGDYGIIAPDFSERF